MKTIYQLLESKQKRRHSFESGSEYSFFLENRYLLEKIPKYDFLYRSEDDYFSVIRANIIIKSYKNKLAIEKVITPYISKPAIDNDELKAALMKKCESLPFIKVNNVKVFIPFFTRSLNESYLENPERFLISPYKDLKVSFQESMIDPFDTYGYHLYNSSFTRMILIKESSDKKEAAFLHYDTNTIYFINDQGRLNDKLVLFDRYIKKPNTYHMFERVNPVVDAYFAFDRRRMIESLRENQFVSEKFMSILRKNDEDNYEV